MNHRGARRLCIIMTMTSAVDLGSTPSNLSTRTGLEAPIGRRARWAGYAVSALTSALLLLVAGMKLVQAPEALRGTEELGYRASVVGPLGWLEIACLITYWIPRTQVLGALLWTGYLGGAVATHVRVGSPLFSHILFPIYVAVLLWGGLWLRSRRVRHLFA
jgi:hypothetical protein